MPLLSVQWFVDQWVFGRDPYPLWELPIDVVEEVRWLAQNVQMNSETTNET
jgi:hypothetical protein